MKIKLTIFSDKKDLVFSGWVDYTYLEIIVVDGKEQFTKVIKLKRKERKNGDKSK